MHENGETVQRPGNTFAVRCEEGFVAFESLAEQSNVFLRALTQRQWTSQLLASGIGKDRFRQAATSDVDLR